MDPATKLGVVCVGGGRGARFGADKLRENLGGESVFVSSLLALRRALATVPIAAVVPASTLDDWRAEFAAAIDVDVVAGGIQRQDSVRLGVRHLARYGVDFVAVHDAARPLVHPEDVVATVDGLGAYDGAILCAPVADTVKQVGDDGVIRATIARDTLRLAQTPQVFRVDALEHAWRHCEGDRLFTDEAAMLEAVGRPVVTVVAKHPNPKVTTPGDLELVRSLRGGS